MMTIDNLLIKIINSADPAIEHQVSKRDIKVLRSLGISVNTQSFITENQSRLLIKILRENCNKLVSFSEEIKTSLNNIVWSKPFRHIEQIRKFYIKKNEDHEPMLFIEMSFSQEIRQTLTILSKSLNDLTIHANTRNWQCDLSEINIVLLYDTLAPLGFEIDETIVTHYETIKSWSKTDICNQFLITNIEHKNFQKAITEDLGLSTSIDQNIINDRSMRYQYQVDTLKNPGENLIEYIANRPKSKIYVDKKQHTVSEVIEALVNLRRLPVLVVFDTFVNNKYLENLKILSTALKDNSITDKVGVYFRLPNDETGKEFNQFIKENQYNYQLDDDTQVAVVMSGKLPKFFLTNAWRPMSVIALDTKMGLRHGKTSVYSNCCDLIIEWADEPVTMDIKAILK